jgi:glutathione S-transferase
MKLYTFALSPNCQKVLAVARELGIALDRVNEDIFKGESKTPAYLAKNPSGRVPLLEDDGLVLSESNAILVYLAGERSAPSLFPAAPRERAEVLRWLFWQSAHLSPAVGKIAFAKVVKPIARQGRPDPAAVAAGSAELMALAKVLDTRLAGRNYLAGELSIADFALVPFIGVAITCGLDVMPYPHLCAWSEQMTSRESVRHTMAEVRAAGLGYAGVGT